MRQNTESVLNSQKSIIGWPFAKDLFTCCSFFLVSRIANIFCWCIINFSKNKILLHSKPNLSSDGLKNADKQTENAGKFNDNIIKYSIVFSLLVYIGVFVLRIEVVVFVVFRSEISFFKSLQNFRL